MPGLANRGRIPKPQWQVFRSIFDFLVDLPPINPFAYDTVSIRRSADMHGYQNWLTQTLFRSPNTANDSGMTGSTGRRSRVRTGPRTYLPIMPSGFPMPAAVCAYRSGHRTKPRLPTWPLPLFRSTTLCLAPSLSRLPRPLCFSRLEHGE